MSTDLIEIEPHCGDDSCKRSHRPDGSHYSLDPKERMVQLTEDGKVGAAYGRLGGRPRNPRASEALAEHARKRISEMKRVIDNALESDNQRIAMDAVEFLRKTEIEEAKMQLDEDKFDHMTQDELIDAVTQLLSNPAMAQALNIDFVEGHVVEEITA